MAWFGRKTSHDKQLRAAGTVLWNLYNITTKGGADAPLVLAFALPDARLRYAMFCLGTMQLACATEMDNPDAILNELLHGMIEAASLPGSSWAPVGQLEPQKVANSSAEYIQDYLHRWSSYVDIAPGNANAATGIVCAMLKHTESSAPANATDGDRLWPLAEWIEAQLPLMRMDFRSMK